MNAVCRLGLVVSLFAMVRPAFAQDKMLESPYYPLQVGNTWTYRLGEKQVGKLPLVVKVTKHEKIGDTLCARVEMFIDGKPSAVEHVSVAKDGIYRHAIGDQKFDKPICLLKLPPAKAATWSIDSKSPDRTLTGKVTLDIVEEVKLADGTTHKHVAVATCTDMKANGLEGSFTCSYAEGVGLIKHQWQTSNANGMMGPYICELEKFEPAKK